MGSDWYDNPMVAVVDKAGRIVLPKLIRDGLGLLPGNQGGYLPVRCRRAGRARWLDRVADRRGGRARSAGDTPVDGDTLFGLIDAGRK
jgi:hypothetical protein